MVAVINDKTPRILKMLDALSQLGNVSWPFWSNEDTTANESISGRCFREGRWFMYVIDTIFFWQQNPGHCERAYLSDLDRARKVVESHDG